MSDSWFNEVNLAWTETRQEGCIHVHDEQGNIGKKKKQEQVNRTNDIYLSFDLSSYTHSI